MPDRIENERSRIAREIHDVLAQELTQLKIDLAYLQRQLSKFGIAVAPEAMLSKFSEMSQLTDTAINCVQRIATELRPVVLDSLGLSAAVEWQARDFQSRTGIQCLAQVPATEKVYDKNVATAIFRILQEALTNVSRHSKATQVRILLRINGSQVRLELQDNGCGIASDTIKSPMSIGLAGMRERAQLLGGHFEIKSRPESGTTVEVSIPMKNSRSSHEGAT